jgi:nucleoside-diphosphate-sugar epimerase
MRALVVGGSGFLGAEVVARLNDAGADVASLSRSGAGPGGVAGDVRLPDLGLDPATAADLVETTTHVVSCFGSVDWRSGPRIAELHRIGTSNVLAFAARMPRLERLVHVSSVLALGRAEGVLGNEDLDVGQAFRSWYDYAKFVSEQAVRDDRAVPWRVVRLGPVLGVGVAGAPSASAGILAALPPLLRGYPAHVADHGSFPCYPADVESAAEVIARALLAVGDGDAWTWYDPASPSLGQVLAGLCAAWGVVPRLVRSRAWGVASQLLARGLGVADVLPAYGERWVELAADVRDPVGEPPACADGYIEATGARLRARASELMPA